MCCALLISGFGFGSGVKFFCVRYSDMIIVGLLSGFFSSPVCCLFVCRFVCMCTCLFILSVVCMFACLFTCRLSVNSVYLSV